MACNLEENTTTVFDGEGLDKVRLPRYVYPNSVIKPYSVREARGQYWMYNIDESSFFEEVYFAHLVLAGEEKCILVTFKKIIMFDINQLVSKWIVGFDKVKSITVESTGLVIGLKSTRGNGTFIPIPERSNRNFLYQKMVIAVEEFNKHCKFSKEGEKKIVINVSGRGDRDVQSVAEVLPTLGEQIGWDLRFEEDPSKIGYSELVHSRIGYSKVGNTETGAANDIEKGKIKLSDIDMKEFLALGDMENIHLEFKCEVLRGLMDCCTVKNIADELAKEYDNLPLKIVNSPYLPERVKISEIKLSEIKLSEIDEPTPTRKVSFESTITSIEFEQCRFIDESNQSKRTPVEIGIRQFIRDLNKKRDHKHERERRGYNRKARTIQTVSYNKFLESFVINNI
ncbi:Vacuolar protein sorting-associated protein 13 [Spathaspora sp. JA1]|nr:Vacuolar protein sorting-associated protein 13 [Spathaspora sp. JA1]